MNSMETRRMLGIGAAAVGLILSVHNPAQAQIAHIYGAGVTYSPPPNMAQPKWWYGLQPNFQFWITNLGMSPASYNVKINFQCHVLPVAKTIAPILLVLPSQKTVPVTPGTASKVNVPGIKEGGSYCRTMYAAIQPGAGYMIALPGTATLVHLNPLTGN